MIACVQKLVGNFKNSGREIRPKGKPEKVRVHDFMIKELGRASPYGVYDLTSNAGWVNVGIDNDKVVKSTKTALDTRSWYEYIWREKQETPKRLEDAAKFIATMISISLTIFMAIGKTAFENY